MKRLSGLIALLILVTVPTIANAHQGNPNFRSEINSIRPAALAEGLDVTVVNFDDHVRLENDTGEDIVIVGYENEPQARILADGTVEENQNSPSVYLNQDRYANIELPERADAEASPEWEKIGENGIYEWHDHRSHYMAEGNPPQVTDESERTKIFDYTIPIRVGGTPAKIDGTLIWAGKDSKMPVIPFAILGLAIVAGFGYWLVRRRREDEARGDAVDADAKGGSEEDKEAW